MLEALIPGIKDQTLPPRDRLGLQNDMFALVSVHLGTVNQSAKEFMLVAENLG